MSKGYAKHKARIDAINLLGKDLARRAGSKCELCETGNERLEPWEPPPPPDDPELDRILLLCGRCTLACDGGAMGNAESWRFLETVMWTDLPALQVSAIRLLNRLAGDGVDWANDAVQTVYPSEEASAWLAGD